MSEWKIFYLHELSDEQKNYFLPPMSAHAKNLVIVAKDIDENNCDGIVFGEINETNIAQAEVCCQALNNSERT